MSGHEQTPSEDQPQELFSPKDWLHPESVSGIIYEGRDLLRQLVKDELTRIDPILRSRDGLCLFRTYANDSTFDILVIDRPDIAEEDNTIVVTNQLRHTYPGEQYYPDGQAMVVTDLVISPTGHWLNSGHDTQFRGPDRPAWKVPNNGTLIWLPKDSMESIQLFGNLKNGNFVPKQERNIHDVENNFKALWETLYSLRLCGEASLELTINDVIL